jgi:hypothetical protein
VILLPSLLAACGEPDLEVKGNIDRVVGEVVTLKLEAGEDGFSGNLELVDARAHKFEAPALKIQKLDDKKLSFVIPVGAAPGKATARVGRKDSDESYNVPLDINRLLLGLDANGTIETLPLSPATLNPGSISDINAAGGFISLSPSGGQLAVLAQDQLSLLALGAAAKPVGPAIQQKDGKAIYAVPDGVLVCTSSALLLVRFKDGNTSQLTATIAGCQAVASDDTGTLAAVLHTCDSDADTTMEDCVTVFEIGSALTEKHKSISLDAKANATHIAMTSDGKGVVVADPEKLYGLWLDTTSAPKPIAVEWKQAATVIGIDRGAFALGDLFVVADAATRKVLLLGFDPNAGYLFKKLKEEITLPDTPTAMAYGLGTQLYIAAGTKLFLIEAEQPLKEAEELQLAAANKLISLVAQP